MTPAARVQAAIEALDAILGGVPAEKALTNWARRSRFAGSKDRAAVRDHVFQALRCRRSYAALGGALTGRGLMIGALRAQGISLSAIFSGETYAPSPILPDEAAAAQATEQDLYDLPDWLIAAFQSSLGSEAWPTAQALRMRAPVVLRVNTRTADLTSVIARLAEEGIECVPSDIAPTALCVREGARRVTASALYQSGAIELQDGSSQAAMAAVPVPAGGRVLDYCAGGGGKTLALAARTQARWFAHDAVPARMADLPPRARRAGIDVTCLPTDHLAQAAPFDLILCDVPCSGSGTWRRSPAAKWELTPAGLDALCATQARILREAAALIAPSGTIAYATCSVLVQENERQIETFVKDMPGWRCVRQQRWAVSDAGDGFFLAILSCR